MAIFRGEGGSGDATNDAANAAVVAQAAATAAQTSASNAATSASAASSSASSASSSATNAASSAASAAASYDSFDDRYLGAKSSAPSVDNDGNTLLVGALYWNTSTNLMYSWTGSAWNSVVSGGTGTVLSVGLSAPTGFTVSGSPVTSTGTLALGFSAGYSLPTTTSQSNWDTAYSWGNHASAGYILSSAIGSTVQGYDADLQAIGALAGTSGLLRKTAANTWTLDTSTFLTANQTITLSGDVTGSGTTGITTTIANGTVAPAKLSTGAPTWDTSSNVGFGMSPDGTALVHITAGNTAKAPLKMTAGTIMTTPNTGSFEYDGVVSYFTNDASSLRGFLPAPQIFRLTTNGSNIGSAIANFFGANSAINLDGGCEYEIEAYCFFTKNTAGTVTVTITTSAAPVNLSGVILMSNNAGGTSEQACRTLPLYNSTSTASAFGATGSLTTGVNHYMIIKLIVEANASASNLRINFTQSAGTVTPLRTSYYKVTKLPLGNTGSFAA